MFKLAKSLSLAKVIAILFAISPFLALGFISDSDAATKFNIKVDPSLQLTVPNTSPSIMLETPDGEIHQTTLNTTITTNNPTGYTLVLLMNGSDLINRTNPDYTIPTIEESVSVYDFANNRWGILGRGDDLYHPATSGYLINTTDAPITNAEENITFGVRVDAELPSGAYDCDLTIVALANRIPYTIDVIDYLQDIDEDVIDSMVVGTQYQLMDERDGKNYFVSKLRDGNVWMTQNLDFELSAEGTTLNPETSDVIAPKTVTVSTNTATWGQDTTLAYYKDGGDLYRPNGLDAAVDSSALDSDSDDQHYQLGSYYSWSAATAGSGSAAEAGAAAPESICPKGWKLPTASADFVNEDNGSTHKLFFNMFKEFHEAYTRYAHTSNVLDDGTQNGNYANNLNTPGEVVTIPGATRLHVRMTYQTENCCDYVVVWSGAHPDYRAASNSGGIGTYRGGKSTVELDVNSDSVTFSIRSDGSVTSYGYYAVVTGYDANGEIIRDLDSPVNLDNVNEDSVVNANEVMPAAPYWMNFAGVIDSTQDWTAALRSVGYWSANYAGSNQSYALFSQEVEEEVDPGEGGEGGEGGGEGQGEGEGGEPETTTYFNAHPNTKIDTTKGLNIRCIAAPAAYTVNY
ncbi:MAG: hypothetical protein K6G36_02120 [Candidatus Saccharibacteria bacterium]|nr:hypothetical protein [Candidatus Saccharibacteria bacterium]